MSIYFSSKLIFTDCCYHWVTYKEVTSMWQNIWITWMEKWAAMLCFSYHYVMVWLRHKMPCLIKFSSPFTLMLFRPVTYVKLGIPVLYKYNYLRQWLLIYLRILTLFSIFAWRNGSLSLACCNLFIRDTVFNSEKSHKNDPYHFSTTWFCSASLLSGASSEEENKNACCQWIESNIWGYHLELGLLFHLVILFLK